MPMFSGWGDQIQSAKDEDRVQDALDAQELAFKRMVRRWTWELNWSWLPGPDTWHRVTGPFSGVPGPRR